MPKKHDVRNLEGDGGDTMVTTIVAAVRTFHSETKQDHAMLAVAPVRVPATQITNMGAKLVTRLESRCRAFLLDDGGWYS